MRAVRAICAALLGVVLLSASAGAADPELRILAGDTVTAQIAEGGGNLAVSVINGPRDQVVTVEVTGLPDVTVTPVATQFAASEQKQISLAIPALKAGAYAASVAVFGADGTSDARSLALTSKAAPAPPAESAPPNTVSLPLPPKLVLANDLLWPSPLFDLGIKVNGEPIANVTIGSPALRLDPAIAPTVSSGLVVSEDGSTATLVQRNGELVVDSLPAAGQYEGTVSVGSGTDAKSVPITVLGRDNVGWALIVLAAGLFIAMKINDYVLKGRPLNALRIVLEELKQRAEKDQEIEKNWLQRSPDQADARRLMGALSPYVVFVRSPGNGACPGVLGSDCDTALQVFEDTGNPTERAKTWARDGTGYTAIAVRLDKLDELYRGVHSLVEAYVDIDASLPSAERNDFNATPTAKASREAAAGALLCSEAELNQRSTALADALAMATEFRELARVYAEVINRSPEHPTPDQASAIKSAHDQLFSPTRGTLDELKAVGPVIDAAYNAVTGNARRADAVAPALTQADAEAMAAQLKSLATGQASTIESMRQAAARADLRYNVLAAILAIGSGLSLLYFTNASFGAFGDYLGLFVWATATTEAVTLARRLAPFG
jgi:hypothetical protein